MSPRGPTSVMREWVYWVPQAASILHQPQVVRHRRTAPLDGRRDPDSTSVGYPVVEADRVHLPVARAPSQRRSAALTCEAIARESDFAEWPGRGSDAYASASVHESAEPRTQRQS